MATDLAPAQGGPAPGPGDGGQTGGNAGSETGGDTGSSREGGGPTTPPAEEGGSGGPTTPASGDGGDTGGSGEGAGGEDTPAAPASEDGSDNPSTPGSEGNSGDEISKSGNDPTHPDFIGPVTPEQQRQQNEREQAEEALDSFIDSPSSYFRSRVDKIERLIDPIYGMREAEDSLTRTVEDSNRTAEASEKEAAEIDRLMPDTAGKRLAGKLRRKAEDARKTAAEAQGLLDRTRGSADQIDATRAGDEKVLQDGELRHQQARNLFPQGSPEQRVAEERNIVLTAEELRNRHATTADEVRRLMDGQAHFALPDPAEKNHQFSTLELTAMAWMGDQIANVPGAIRKTKADQEMRRQGYLAEKHLKEANAKSGRVVDGKFIANPHLMAARGALEESRKLEELIPKIGKAGTVAGAYFGLRSAIIGYGQDIENGESQEQAIASNYGSWAVGTAAGIAVNGLVAGAISGMPFGGVGAIPGAILGGIAGAGLGLATSVGVDTFWPDK